MESLNLVQIRRERIVKKGILLLASICLASCVPTQNNSMQNAEPKAEPPALAKDSSSIASAKALVSYNSQYLAADKHKAFAQSKTGAWAWTAGRTSIESAVDYVLERCRARNKKREHIYPCKIININDKWEAELNAK